MNARFDLTKNKNVDPPQIFPKYHWWSFYLVASGGNKSVRIS